VLKIDPEGLELNETVVFVNRVSKVVKGGRRFGFSAMVVVGNGEGIVGIGYGKAKDVSEAIKKGVAKAKKSLIRVRIKKGTIPYTIIGRYGAARVFMKPASPGTGVIAGGSVRTILEAAGYQNILTKCYYECSCKFKGCKKRCKIKREKCVGNVWPTIRTKGGNKQ